MNRQEAETSENDFSEQEVTFRGKKEEPKKVEKKPEAPKDGKKPKSNFVVRTIYTLLMLFGFFALVAAGPFYSLLLILFISYMMFSELLRLKRRVDKEKEIPLFNLLNWYFFTATIYYSLGKLVQTKIPHLLFENENIHLLMKYHNVIYFALWSAGFVMFTLSLKQGFYKYQLRVFGWTHIGCFFIVSSTSVMSQNMYEGMIWFLLPATLVISNDIFAYIFGFFLGKHSLIKLSPKKTWEGFIGGAACSILWAFLLSYFASFVPALMCPQRKFNLVPFVFEGCTYLPYMEFQPVPLPGIFNYLGLYNIWVSEFNIHAMIMSLFASLIAPFGGFFASGIKRALKIKDFGDVIPGHGGLIDRFDCQLIMGMFSYVYLHSIILAAQNLNTIVTLIDNLGVEDQLSVYKHLQSVLQDRNVL